MVRLACLVAALACGGCLVVGHPAPPITADRHPSAPRPPAHEDWDDMAIPAHGDPPPAVAAPRPGAVPAPSAGTPELPAAWMTPLTRPWRFIVLHHSATETGGAARFDRSHRRDRGWDRGLGYHFVIGNGTDTGDGVIEVGPRWARQEPGAHAGTPLYNEQGIGICLVGDFRTRAPSVRQLDACRRLIAALRARCGIPASRVVGHCDVRPGTECPGACFAPHHVLPPPASVSADARRP